MLSAEAVGSLLEELCVALGFCLPPDARRRLQRDPPADADAFTTAVFRAEGMDPATASRQLHRQVRAAAGRAYRDPPDRDA